MITKMLEKWKLTEYTPIEKFILEKDYRRIGNLVINELNTSDEKVMAAVSICRRRFKVSDIILLVILDEEQEGEAGIAFTQNGIYHWKGDEEYIGGVSYNHIRELDYDEENVMVTDKDGVILTLWCGEDTSEKYSRYMYNFIMDIKEYAEENGTK